MPRLILMPSLSPTMKSGNLVSWCKMEGDKVSAGEVVAEIDTDKVTMEVESSHNGVLYKMLICEGTYDVVVGTPLAIVKQAGDSEEDIEKFIKETCRSIDAPAKHDMVGQVGEKQNPTKMVADNFVSEQTRDTKIKISPLAKKLAAERRIDIRNIVGSGPGCRIIKNDILIFEEEKRLEYGIIRNSVEYVDEQQKSLRRTIADRLTYSKQNIPHFYLDISCNMGKAVFIKSVLNQNNNESKITLNDIIVKAVSNAIVEYPEINVSWIDGKIRRYNNVDVCIAVSTQDGLFTPVIRNADKKSLQEISSEIKDKTKLAKESKLSHNDYTGGSLTVSNLGMFGIKSFHPIINPPQSGILAIGAVEKRVVITENDKICSKHFMDICLSVDHRILDGSQASGYLNTLKRILEDFVKII